VAIIDVTPSVNAGFSIADGLLALPAPPTIILTSSTDRTDFGTRLDGRRFIAKAEICAAAITRLARTAGTGRPESAKSRHSPRSAPAKGISSRTSPNEKTLACRIRRLANKATRGSHT
jgi:hypothetical protein